jgi:hypothetical protein
MAFDFRGGKRERLSVSKVSKSSWAPMDDRRYKYGAEFVQLCVFFSAIHPISRPIVPFVIIPLRSNCNNGPRISSVDLQNGLGI